MANGSTVGNALTSAFNNFVGWGLSTLALRFLNKTGGSDTTYEPDTLSITETKLGTPIPVVFGRHIIKSPLISYFGDFSSRAYTEEYAAHATFNAWPLVLSLIATYIATMWTGHTSGGAGNVVTPDVTVTSVNTTVTTSGGSGTGRGTGTGKLDNTEVSVEPHASKDDMIGPLLNSLFVWLLSWLINGRNLKTTIQKGFKYYIGYQQVLCWSHKNARLRRVWMNEKKVWEGDEPMSNHTDGLPFIIKVDDENLFGGVDESGGFVGELHVYFGGENQTVDSWMVSQMSADSVQEELRGYTPAYKDYISVVVPKAYVGKKATIPTMWYEVQINPNPLEESMNASYTDYLKGLSAEIGYSNDFVSIISSQLDTGTMTLDLLKILLNEMSTKNSSDGIIIDAKIGTTTTTKDREASVWQMFLLSEIIKAIEVTKEPNIGDDCNPANVLLEIVSNKKWGLSETYTVQNLSTLALIAERLKKEKLGISCLYTSKQEARTIIDDICEHINAIRYADERTSNIAYKLIRDDFASLRTVVGEWDITLKRIIPEVNESNCLKITFVRQDWSNTISEVSINYTDRNDIYETSTVTSDDIANVEIQHGIKTTKSYDFPLFTTSDNALWASRRLIEAEAYPLATVSLELNREFFEVRLGDVLSLNFPPYGIENMIVRVNNVSHADFESGVISVDAIEDVFALSKTKYNYSDKSEWMEEPKYPDGAQYFGFFEMPFEITRVHYTYVYAFCCKPSQDTVTWSIWRLKQGEDKWKKTNTMSKWTATGKIVYGYKQDTDDIDYSRPEIRDIGGLDDLAETISLAPDNDANAARSGTYLVFAGNEIMSYSTIKKLDNGNFVLEGVIRGVYDTVPETHQEGEQFFFLLGGHYANVITSSYICKLGTTTTEHYNITTSSIDHEEDFDDLKVVELKTTRRADRPNVQGNVKLTYHGVNEDRYPTSIYGDLHITWSPRNKTQTNGCVSQGDTNDYFSDEIITLPANCEYVVNVKVNGNIVKTYQGINNFFDMTYSERCSLDSDFLSVTEIEIYTVDTVQELESYQKQIRNVIWKIPYIVGICFDEQEALTLMSTYDDNGKCNLPHSNHNDYAFLKYTEMPVILLGTRLASDNAGAIPDRDGNFWQPTGKMLAFTSKDAYYNIDLTEDYVVYNPFRRILDTSGYYYRWNNNIFSDTGVV